MDINEKDIFDYLFHPELMNKQKREFIENNPTSQELIKEFVSLKNYLDENSIDDSVRKKLALRIPAYNMVNKIELLPLNDYTKRINSFQNLSSDENFLSDTTFFIDDAYKYFVKINKKIDHNQIFLFSSKVEMIKEYTLTFYPSNISIYRYNNLDPIVTDIPSDFENIDKIELEFH